MNEGATRNTNASIDAARRRLERLKLASVAASVFAFCGLTTVIAVDVAGLPAAASSSSGTTSAPQGADSAPATAPTDGGQAQADPNAAPVPDANAAAPQNAPPIVSAQS